MSAQGASTFLAALKAIPDHGPPVSVVLEGLSHTVSVPVRSSGITNVAESSLKFLSGGPFARVPQQPLPILTSVSATFAAGTATLVLGNSGGGKTTLLNLAAGRLAPTSPECGRVLWNGVAPPACGAQVSKVAALAPQVDVHEPLLTVRETLDFAAACCLAPSAPLRAELVGHVIATLGLAECADVKLGSEQVQGVSGGQKKRVTLAEALCSGARVLALDEVTNGLDSAVALDVCRFLAAWAATTGGTVICALQAPTPEILGAFHSVLLLSEGRALWQGRPGQLRSHLATLGYAAPTFMDTADYALSLCISPDYTAESFAGEVAPAPALRTREGLAALWAKATPPSPAAAGVALASPFAQAQYARPQVHSAAAHVGLLLGRQAKVTQRNPAVSIGRVMQFLILASIFGSIYYKLGVDQFVEKISLCIFALSAVSFASFAEIPAIFIGRRTASRQLDSGFYNAPAYVLSVAINSLPVSLLSSFLFATILYWMTGFAWDAGRYFFFILVLASHELATSALFRFMAFSFPTEELAAAAAGICTGALLIFGGFYIARPLIPDYFLSVYYGSPFSWSVRSMCISEFTADSYMVPLYPGAAITKSDRYLSAFGFYTGDAWKWGGVGYCLGFALVFGLLLSSLSVYYLRAKEAPGAQRLTEEQFRAAATASAAALGRSASGSALPASASTPDLPGAAATTAAAAVAPTSDAAATASVLPFAPVTLSFKDISYSVKLPTGALKPLLQGITGTAAPATLTALMGASGAGKTTLLNVLAFRTSNRTHVGGAIHLNATPATPAAFTALSGFAEQSDVHCDFMRVGEAVAFSAALRLPASVSPTQRAAYVAQVLELLELTPLAQRRTGSLSPGEAKRLTIAVEMAANPALLFLDEPTTGLDARSAAVVMRVLRRIADTGRTVVATIHQPSASIFFSFDTLLCLAPGGLQTYSGALGQRSSALVGFLQACPGVQPLPEGTNPASWMLEEMSRNTANNAAALAAEAAAAAAAAAAAPASEKAAAPAAALQVRAVELAPSVAKTYQTSPLALTTEAAVAAVVIKGQAAPAPLPRPALGAQYASLLTRWSLFHWRNTAFNFVRLIVFLTLAVFFGLLYRGIDDSNTTAFFGKLAVALNGQLFLAIINLNTSLPNYSRMRAVFYRESAVGTYGSLAYPLALVTAELPWSAFFALAFSSINYFLVGFVAAPGPFFISVLAVFSVALWYAVMAAGFIAFFPVALLAQIAGGPTIQISILFAGVNLSRDQLPAGWRFLYDADGFAHSLRLFFLPQYTGDSSPLFDLSTGLPYPGGKQAYMVARLGQTTEKLWDEFGYLMAIVLSAVVLMVLFYAKINHQKR